jgi:branched-chain amino acid transport system substrate-binding protein
MKKRLSMVFYLLLALFVVVGCSSTGSSSGSSTETNSDSETSNNTTANSGGSSEDTLTIGAILPLTGSGAAYGEMFKKGIELAVEEINANGGIDGKQLAVDYQDGRAEPKASVQAAQTLAAKDYPAIISAYTGVTLAVLPIAERNNMVVFNGGGQGDSLAGASPNLFNTIPLLGLEVEVLARYIGEEMKDSKKAFVIHVDDDSGRSGLEEFKKDFSKYGGEIVGSGSHNLGETNYRPILIKAKAANPDLIYIASHGQDAKLAIDQARQLGIKAQIVNTSWTIIPKIVSDPDAQGVVHTSLAFNPDKEWLDKFEKKYGTREVSSYVANYYDAIKIFKEAYEYAKEKGYGTDGNAVVKAINELKEFKSANGTITFREDGTSVRQVDISIIKDKKSQVIKTY